MKRLALLCTFLTLTASAIGLPVPDRTQTGPDWLAYIEYGPGEDVFTVAATGLTVVFELEQGCLVTANEADLARLGPTFGVRRLDANPEQKYYYYIMTLRGPLPPLEEYGVVLHRDDWTGGADPFEGAVLRTDEELPDGLDCLPVELVRLRLRPIHIGAEPHTPRLTMVSRSVVQKLVDRVSQDTVEAFIQRLQDFRTRYSTTDSCRAAMQWAFERFEAYGCDTVFEFPFRQGFAPNVIGIRYGKVNPNLIYGICGHADATSERENRLTHAPGADDNGSGTAAVLEAARVFQDVEFENTVYFMAFSGEEQGLYGSDSFAEYCYRREDSIMAVLNFDMISYGREGLDSLEVYGKNWNPNCAWLVDFYIAQADTFTDLKIRRRLVSSLPYSDHHSFWIRGYPAILGIERDFTPVYHTIGDTIGPLYYRWCGTNNLPLATSTIKAAVASLARLAGASELTGVSDRPMPTRAAGLVAVRPGIGVDGFRLLLSAPARPGSRLRIYNATGRLVRELEIAGRAEAYWDGRDERGRAASAGSYLLRMTDGRRTTTLRAILADQR